MTVEHLLLALLDNSAARDALKACGADIEAIKSELLAFVKDTTPLILDDQLNERETQPTLGFQRVLQRAVFHVQSLVRTKLLAQTYLLLYSASKSLRPFIFLRRRM